MKISEYKQLFLSEAQEILNSLNKILVELEKKPEDPGLINELFRQSHTLKSMAQSMGYDEITGLTHSMESTLSLIKSGKLKAEKETVDLLFKSLDTLLNLVEAVRKGETKKVKVAPLIERFEEIASAVPGEERMPAEEKRSNLRLEDIDRRHIVDERNKGVITYRLTVSLKTGVKDKKLMAQDLVKKLQDLGEVIRAPFLYRQIEGGRFGRHFGLFFVTKHSSDEIKKEIEADADVQGVALRPLEIDEIILPSKKKEAEDVPVPISAGEAQSVRVPLTQLDGLMDAIGELVINKSRLSSITRTVENKPLGEAVAQMSRLTSHLQYQMMQVRLIPLEYIFTPYSRMVRDIAASESKKVDLVIEGSNIGLDRAMQDEINGPLLHLLKNAVTHGIEKPEERERKKKPKRGKIKLVAKRERNHVAIELSDDGRGIDIEETREVSVKRGIIAKEELAALTPKEEIMLITSPGYSGAKKVTEAAGRGVGLSAVRSKVESFGGSLNIETTPGEGTAFLIKLPLTMAVTQAMLVGLADETYCIPLSYIVEAIKVASGDIKTMEHHEVISYRDTVLPLVRLKETLGFAQPSVGETGNPGTATGIPVVVVESGTRRIGLVVDSLLDQQEVVIKSLTGILKQVRYVSGATILGTGKASLIVDVPSLV
ncbi:MAG: chemotaxis protein CheA [Candidatus Omnitrophica bacterium]|nr:chemotaxis protein CheA [Candidatus Omnitrophota bacterium]